MPALRLHSEWQSKAMDSRMTLKERIRARMEQTMPLKERLQLRLQDSQVEAVGLKQILAERKEAAKRQKDPAWVEVDGTEREDAEHMDTEQLYDENFQVMRQSNCNTCNWQIIREYFRHPYARILVCCLLFMANVIMYSAGECSVAPDCIETLISFQILFQDLDCRLGFQ